MNLFLYSKESYVLDQVQVFMKKLPDSNKYIKEIKRDNLSAEYVINNLDNDYELLLNQLLKDFPELDIRANIINDFEGRDRSFWNTTSYKSVLDKNGERHFEISRSTGWH